MSKPDNIQIYDANAKQLVERYESTTTEQALPPFVDILRDYTGKSRNALDIGSGSGRDAFWMAQNGWNVDAVDGSKALLDEARSIHEHDNIRFIHDLAPDFQTTRNADKKYDVVLLSAFIFHFDKDDRNAILEFCLNTLRPSGFIYMTLRHGPLPPKGSIFDVQAQEIKNFASRNNLSFHDHGRMQDTSGLQDIAWYHLSMWRGAPWDHAREHSFDPAHR